MLRIVACGIGRRVNELLGLDMMSRKFRILALNYLFLMVYYTLEGVFVNTLLYRISPDMLIVIRYRAVMYICCALAMNLAAYVCKKKSPVTTIKLGGLFYIIMYIILFFGMNYMQQLMYIVAFFSGFGAGFYWSGHNVLITHYTDRRNRGVGVSIMGLIQGVMTLLVPVISGVVISVMPGTAGYRVMFGIGMLVVALQSGLQKKLEPIEQSGKKSELRLAFKLLWRKSTCQLMMGAEILRGFRDGTFTFFLNMLLFQLVTSESLVGMNTFVTGALAILGSWAYGKLAGPGRRVKLMIASTTLLLAVNLLLRIWSGAAMVMIFSAVNSFAQIFILYSINTYSFDVMAQNDMTRRCMAELGGFREFFLTIGRLLGLWVVTLFPQTVEGYILAMLILTASQYLAALMVKLIKDTLDRKQIARVSKHY